MLIFWGSTYFPPTTTSRPCIINLFWLERIKTYTPPAKQEAYLQLIYDIVRSSSLVFFLEHFRKISTGRNTSHHHGYHGFIWTVFLACVTHASMIEDVVCGQMLQDMCVEDDSQQKGKA